MFIVCYSSHNLCNCCEIDIIKCIYSCNEFPCCIYTRSCPIIINRNANKLIMHTSCHLGLRLPLCYLKSRPKMCCNQSDYLKPISISMDFKCFPFRASGFWINTVSFHGWMLKAPLLVLLDSNSCAKRVFFGFILGKMPSSDINENSWWFPIFDLLPNPYRTHLINFHF